MTNKIQQVITTPLVDYHYRVALFIQHCFFYFRITPITNGLISRITATEEPDPSGNRFHISFVRCFIYINNNRL
ncbi:hypothetical protein, partial [Candidatus Enterovibrio escicola]|uniref:hypothetical protein n=1 Tax=Candidatus Enterovibrio escicola TaxID=1927127 RepID=UPI001CC2AC3D